MRISGCWIAATVLVTACGGESKPAAKEGTTTVPPEVLATLDAYASVFDRLASDLGAAAPDCAKGVAVANSYMKELDALEGKRAQLAEAMAKVSTADEGAASAVLAKRYAERFKTATLKWDPLVKACHDDPALQASMSALMSRFPMMRKKS